jgi:antitoxin ParD1/3/4
MVKITLSIPEDLQAFLECQTIKNGFRLTDDYLCNLLKGEQEREQLEGILIEGVESGEPIEVDDDWWEQKRDTLIKLQSQAPKLNTPEGKSITNLRSTSHLRPSKTSVNSVPT